MNYYQFDGNYNVKLFRSFYYPEGYKTVRDIQLVIITTLACVAVPLNPVVIEGRLMVKAIESSDVMLSS